MSSIEEVKRLINLREYLETYEGHSFRGSKTLCPFHTDTTPSMDVNFVNDCWRFYCHSCKAQGDIIEYIKKKHSKGIHDVIKELKEKYELNKDLKALKSEYIYRDINGEEVFKKVKILKDDNSKEFLFYHKDNNTWVTGKGNHDAIPYNLDRFKDFNEIIVCEGEKDADNVNALGTEFLATSAPFGMNSWHDCLTHHFKDFHTIFSLYDVGAEKCVEKHATKLKEAFPSKAIYIADVPMKKKQDDISDYLEKFSDLETKRTKLLEILRIATPFELGQTLEEKGSEDIFIGTFEDFMLKPIPEVENLVDPYVFRGGLTEIGGVKGSHKSFFVTNMAFYFASGISPFLTAVIEKPGRIMLIQQEISLGFMKKRLLKMRMSGSFLTEERFYPISTTARQLKLLDKDDYNMMRSLIEKFEPDILILDPLSTFNTSEENMSKDMSKIINRLSELKAIYNLGLVITHHFSSKRNPNDPVAPIEAGGWFRGHTVLSDAADVLICLHRLPGQRDNPNLPKPYEDYNLVEISLRNDRNPAKFAVEFDEGTFLLKESDIWQEIGKKIMPGQIEELLKANDGEMLQKDVIEYFKPTVRPTTVKRAINEAVYQKIIFKESLKGRGTPVLLKLSPLKIGV